MLESATALRGEGPREQLVPIGLGEPGADQLTTGIPQSGAMKQQYLDWSPVPETPKNVEVLALRDENDGLEVFLAPAEPYDRTRVFRIRFNGVVAYRCINESYRLKTWWERNQGGENSSLQTVSNSSWVSWLEEESGGVLSEFDLTHYAIYTGDDCIDVVAIEMPDAAWLDPSDSSIPTIT